MRWAGAILGLLAFGVAGLGQDNPDEQYKQKLASINKSCAAKHYSVGEYLTSSQMHLWAREQYNKTIQFDPDHEGARRKLGYKKGSGGWENDPDAKIEGNKKKENDAEGQRIKKGYLDKIETAGKDISRQWSDLALWCKKNNLAKETADAFQKAIEYDPTNTVARKELGYEKDAKGVWISKAERELRKEMKDGIAKAPSGAATDKETPVEKALAQKHAKRESAHIHIESPHLKDAELGTLLQHAEHAYAMYHKIMRETEDIWEGRRLNLVILKDKAQHLKYVDAFDRGSAAQKELSRKSRGMGGEMYQEVYPLSVVEDHVVHQTAQTLSHYFVGGDHLWIHEGTAYIFTRLMLDTAAFTCVDLAGTSPGAGEAKNLQDPANWPVILKVWIRENKDPNIDAVVKCTNLADFDGPKSLKGWSLLDFLLAEHHTKFLDFCKALKKGASTEDAFKGVWGWTTTDLDQRWKQYVKTSY